MSETLPQKRKGGRRTKLTPETHDRIVNAVRAGATFQSASGAAGIPESTLYRWLQEAETPGAPPWKREFREALYRARDELEVRVVAGSVLKSAMGGYMIEETRETRRDGTVVERRKFQPADGRVGLEILARRFHDRGWGRNPVEVTGADGGPVLVQHSLILDLAGRLEAEMAGRVVENVVEAELVEREEEEDDL